MFRFEVWSGKVRGDVGDVGKVGDVEWWRNEILRDGKRVFKLSPEILKVVNVAVLLK